MIESVGFTVSILTVSTGVVLIVSVTGGLLFELLQAAIVNRIPANRMVIFFITIDYDTLNSTGSVVMAVASVVLIMR